MLNLFYLLALCLVPFASGSLSEHGNRVTFSRDDDPFIALGRAVGPWVARAVLAKRTMPPGARQDMILSPLFTAIVFLTSASVALGGRVNIAHWVLLMIVPVSTFFGSRSRKAA